MALAGDGVALRLCLDRIAPPRKDSPVQFALPRMFSTRDAAQAAGAVLEAVALGELTPTEGAVIMGLVDAFRRTLEVTELEARLAALEGVSKPTSPLGLANAEVPPVEQGRSSRE